MGSDEISSYTCTGDCRRRRKCTRVCSEIANLWAESGTGYLSGYNVKLVCSNPFSDNKLVALNCGPAIPGFGNSSGDFRALTGGLNCGSHRRRTPGNPQGCNWIK